MFLFASKFNKFRFAAYKGEGGAKNYQEITAYAVALLKRLILILGQVTRVEILIISQS